MEKDRDVLVNTVDTDGSNRRHGVSSESCEGTYVAFGPPDDGIHGNMIEILLGARQQLLCPRHDVCNADHLLRLRFRRLREQTKVEKAETFTTPLDGPKAATMGRKASSER
jgi:hypothetical protein